MSNEDRGGAPWPAGGGFSDPLDRRIWSDVRLGGTYKLLPTMEEVHVLVDLTGEEWGYRVESCRVVEPDEFDRFQADLARWQTALTKYFDVYQ